MDAYLSLVANIDKAAGKSYNIGSGESISIKALVGKILKIMNSDATIDYRESDFSESSHKSLDSSKIRNDLGWYSKIGIEEGLKRTIKSYGSNNK